MVSSPHRQHRNNEQSSSTGPSFPGLQRWASSPHLQQRNCEHLWAVVIYRSLIYRTAMFSSPHLQDRNGQQSTSTGPQWWAHQKTAMVSISRGPQWWAYLEDRNEEQSTFTKLQCEQIIIITTIIMIIIDNFVYCYSRVYTNSLRFTTFSAIF